MPGPSHVSALLAVGAGPGGAGLGALAAAIAAGSVSGFLLACQPGVNGTLCGKFLAHPLHAALTSFVVGLACAVVACLLIARSLPKPADYAGAPWWAYTGGAMGAVLVTASILFGPKVGAANWLGILVVSQLAGAVVLDHWGLVGYPVRPATWVRLVGVALLIGGAVLVIRGGAPQG